MKATDFVKMQLEMSHGWIFGLIEDMKDAPMTEPTPNGGNHPLWVLGHLTYSEANILHVLIKGEKNPLAEWKDIFGMGSTPTLDASAYPSFDAVKSKYDATRAESLAFVESLTDADLDKPSHAEGDSAAYFGTIGQCLATMAVHFAFHGGQVADARRAAGRGALMG